jgi:Uma2 family endonuclease
VATIATRIGPADHGRKMTLKEFRAAEVVEGYRYELIRGLLHAEDIPDEDHCQVVCNLYRILSLLRQSRPDLILRFGGASEFRLWLAAAVSGLCPDLGVVLRGTPRDGRGRRNPSFVAEVVTAETRGRDCQTKRQDYLAYGILEYWMIDLTTRQVNLLVRDGDVWLERSGKQAGALESIVLPGLPATVSDLWIDLDDDTGAR